MKAFGRLFGYVWPQWPRVIVVFVSAMAIAILISISFMTIIPLLKVMIGSEGLHGWIDRKTCEYRYGLQFRIPDLSDLRRSDPNRSDEPVGSVPSLLNHLEVIHVAKDSLAARAGIQDRDFISDVNKPSSEIEGYYTRLLLELATTKDKTITLRRRMSLDRTTPSEIVELKTPYDQEYIDSLDWSRLERLKCHAQLAGLRTAHWAVSYLPRDQSDKSKVKAIVVIMTAMLLVTLIRCIAKFFQGYIGQKIVQTSIHNLREDLFAHLVQMPTGAFAGERPSDTISRIVRDTGTMSSAIRVMLGKALREPMNALFMLGAAMLINWQLTLIFLCSAPAIVGLLGVFGSKMKKATRRSLVSSSLMLAKLQEVVTALRVVKVYNQQEHEQDQFNQINHGLLKQLLRISRVDAATQPVLEILGMTAGAAAIIVGMTWIARGGLDGAEFLTLLALLGAAAEATRKTSDIWNRIQQANAAAERVFVILDEPLEIEAPDAKALSRVKGNVTFQDVIFSYPKEERPTLTGVNLSVTAGHNVAIVGANGSGKTTLANLLPRFYDPDSGQILIDGQDIRNVTLRSLRDQIAMVTQQTITFNDTVRANIAYGRRDAGEEEIVAAARRAFAHEFISQLPDGYDTVIGENGVGLSGGQLQRVVIARAILKNPAILIFDEATSQVDADSEAKIHQAIEEVMQDRTTFVIAHRFSTVVAADVIVVMDSGRILAQGQHDELMQTCPIYQGLYETQLVKA